MANAAIMMAEMLEKQISMLTADGFIETAIEAEQEAIILRMLADVEAQ